MVEDSLKMVDNNPYSKPEAPSFDADKAHRYQTELLEIRIAKNKIRETLGEIVGRYSSAKQHVRGRMAEVFSKAQENTKKSAGIEILETYACATGSDEDKMAYNDYNYYGAKKDMLGKMLESYNQDQSALQSEMKFFAL